MRLLRELRYLPTRLWFMLRTRKWPSNLAMVVEQLESTMSAGSRRRFADAFYAEDPLFTALKKKSVKNPDDEPTLGDWE